MIVAPIGATCQCTARANPQLALLLAWKSRQSRETFRVCLFRAFKAWYFCLDTILQSLEYVRVLFDWFLAFTLWGFAFFYRFHILALGHLVALCNRAFLRSFGFLLVQSTFWLLSCTCSVIVKLFIALFEWFSSFRLDFAWLRFGLRLHGPLRYLRSSLGSEGLPWYLQTSLYFHWVKFVFLLFVIISQNLFSALCHWKENEQSLLRWMVNGN